VAKYVLLHAWPSGDGHYLPLDALPCVQPVKGGARSRLWWPGSVRGGGDATLDVGETPDEIFAMIAAVEGGEAQLEQIHIRLQQAELRAKALYEDWKAAQTWYRRWEKKIRAADIGHPPDFMVPF